MSNIAQRAVPATQLTINAATLSGTPALIGVFNHSPVIVIFDNQADVAVVITINGVSWKTFPAGEALVLDMRGNHGNAPNFTFDQGTTVMGSGSAGTGIFSVSYLYAQPG